MIRRPPRSTRTDTLFPYTTLFRSTLFQQSPVRWRPLSPRKSPSCPSTGASRLRRCLPELLAVARLPASSSPASCRRAHVCCYLGPWLTSPPLILGERSLLSMEDRKSTRLNSSH